MNEELIKRALAIIEARATHYYEEWRDEDDISAHAEWIAYDSAAGILEAAMRGDIEELNNFDYFKGKEE